MGSGRPRKPGKWNLIRAEYEAGDKIADIAARHKVKDGTITSRKSREGWERKAGQTSEGSGNQNKTPPQNKIETQNAKEWLVEVKALRETAKKGRKSLNLILDRLSDEANRKPETVGEGENKVEVPPVSALYIADVMVKFSNAANKLVATEKLLYQAIELVGSNDMTEDQKEEAKNDLSERLKVAAKHRIGD